MVLSADEQGLAASCYAGLVSRIVCHPMDTFKARLQAPPGTKPVGSVYRGLVAALVGGVPATCIYLTSYEQCKLVLSDVPRLQDSPFAVYFTSGMVAEACSCLVFVPTDVIKERLQVQGSSSSYKYRGSFDALRQIVAHEGLRGLYKGYGASMLSYGPFSALYFAFYESLKRQHSPGGGETFLENLYSSALAGAAASYLTNPLDLAKLRLQVARAASPRSQPASSTAFEHNKQGLGVSSTATAPPSTSASMLAHVYRIEGMRGLFRGAVARVLFHTPNTAITMCVFEECKRWLKQQDNP